TILSVPEASVKTIRSGLPRYVAIVADTPTAVMSGQPASESRHFSPLRLPATSGYLGGMDRHFRRCRQRSAVGLVSRASPVQTAVRNCTRDEGGPFGFGDQVADPKPPQAAVGQKSRW